MSTSSSNHNQTTKSYRRYNRDMRLKLIELVEEKKMSTAEAGRIIGIKQTSACRIINTYRKHNRIFERKSDRLCREGGHFVQIPSKLRKVQGKNVLKIENQESNGQQKSVSIQENLQRELESVQKVHIPAFPNFEIKSNYSTSFPFGMNHHYYQGLDQFGRTSFWPPYPYFY